MNQKILSDPVKIGPGLWIFIHLKAKNAVDPKGKEEFMSDMNLYYQEFPCAKCRGHLREYMDTHPFEPFMNMKDTNGREIGLFKWTWMFHNAVNTRLHKPYLDWQTVYEMYELDKNEITPCVSCGEEEVPILKTDKSKIIQGYFLKKGVPETLKKHGY